MVVGVHPLGANNHRLLDSFGGWMRLEGWIDFEECLEWMSDGWMDWWTGWKMDE